MKIFLPILICILSYSALASDNVNLSVSPEKGFILPGSAASCRDLSDYKKSKLRTDSTPAMQLSIVGPRLSFSNLSLIWDPNTNLSVTLMRVEILSDSIEGGRYYYDLVGDEVATLIGGSVALGKGVMNSSDSARDCDPETKKNVMTGLACQPQSKLFNPYFAACGLDVGGIRIVANAPSFTAPVTIELYGFTADGKGSFEPVYVKISTEVQYQAVRPIKR